MIRGWIFNKLERERSLKYLNNEKQFPEKECTTHFTRESAQYLQASYFIGKPVIVSQSLTVESREAETSCWLSGEKATELIVSLCPSNVGRHTYGAYRTAELAAFWYSSSLQQPRIPHSPLAYQVFEERGPHLRRQPLHLPTPSVAGGYAEAENSGYASRAVSSQTTALDM